MMADRINNGVGLQTIQQENPIDKKIEALMKQLSDPARNVLKGLADFTTSIVQKQLQKEDIKSPI